jgi:helicase
MPDLIQIKEYTDSETTNIVLDTLEKNKQALVFVNSKSSAEKTAETIALEIKKQKLAVNLECNRLAEEILNALSKPTKQCERAAACIKYGIAFHHAGLVQKQKTAIENAFRTGIIKCIACTPTLAMGVDLPAYRAIIRDLKRFSKNWGSTSISVLEYQQMAGRAGRPGKDTKGEAITIAKTDAEKENIYEEFITGDVEDIYSKLAIEPVLRTYLLSLIATEYVRTKEQILSFFSKTFWAYQYKDMVRLEKIINKMLKLLKEYGFIETNEEEFSSAAEYETLAYTATGVGKRVAELYLDPLTAYQLICGMKRTKTKSITSFTLLHLICTQLELRPLLTVKTKEYEEVEQVLLKHTADLLVSEPQMYDPEYDEFLKSIKTSLFFEAWIHEAGEEEILKQFDVRPGELHAKKERADWILYACVEMAKLLQFHELEKEFLKLRVRVEQGVKEELFALLRLEGVGRVRARKLYDHKLRDLGAIKAVDMTTLTQLLGPKTAVSLKKQVGIDVEKIPVKENKRKGQISLMDY